MGRAGPGLPSAGLAQGWTEPNWKRTSLDTMLGQTEDEPGQDEKQAGADL